MYQFTITISADGKDADEAWNEAVQALAMDPGSTPEDYVRLDENDEEITIDELKKLKELLEAFQAQEYIFSGYKSINGGYANAEAGTIDEDAIEIYLEVGVQNMGDGTSERTNSTYYISREAVRSDISVDEKLKLVRDEW